MRRASATVVAVVSDEASLDALRPAANVRVVSPDRTLGPLDRAVEAWRQVGGVHAPFLVHDADPLAAVAAAWVAYYDQQGTAGDLEVAVTATLARWRAGSLQLPDYYLVVGAEELTETRRHFHLGFLHRAAPARVVPAQPTPAALRRLRAGRWWPDLDRLLDGVEAVVPDRL